jgi:hypothetical protein
LLSDLALLLGYLMLIFIDAPLFFSILTLILCPLSTPPQLAAAAVQYS